MLFSHRAPCTAPGRVTRQPKVRSGFSGQTLAAPQVFYRESSSQIERAGGLELPLGTRSAASQHGGPVSALRHPLVTAALSFATTCSVGTTLFPDMCPQRLGVAWSLRWMATTPGLLVIARADDVDGVAVTGIKGRAD